MLFKPVKPEALALTVGESLQAFALSGAEALTIF
jgi:hypothetical protein